MTTHLHAKPPGTPTWTDLTTPNIDAARRFYQAVFGWEYDISGPEFGGYTTARLGQRMTAGLTTNPPEAPPQPAGWGLYFASPNAEADVSRAVTLGSQVMFPALEIGAFGSMAVCLDPTGAPFGLWQANQHVGWQVTDEPGSTAWHELYTPNAKQARDFYMALLGATADPMPGGLEYYVLKHGDKMLAGIMQIDPAWGGMLPQWVSYFAVADAEATVALVTRNGGQVLGPIDDSPFGRIAALRDPEGATFKIVQPAAP